MPFHSVTIDNRKLLLSVQDPVIPYLQRTQTYSIMDEYTIEERRAHNSILTIQCAEFLKTKFLDLKSRQLAQSFLSWKQTGQAKNFITDFFRRNPKLHAKDFKSAFECPAFEELLAEARAFGTSEATLRRFVETVRELRKTSLEAAQVFLEPFWAQPELLREFQLILITDWAEPGRVFTIPPPFRQLMKRSLHDKRQTGKGELGLVTLFQNRAEWLSTPPGDWRLFSEAQPEGVTVEIKSLATRSQHIRFGSGLAWSDSHTHCILAHSLLRNSALMKGITHGDVEKHALELCTVFGSLSDFKESMRQDVLRVAQESDKLFAYIESEEVIIDVQPDMIHPYGITPEGRWKATIIPNRFCEV